jgi:hypothetical protein
MTKTAALTLNPENVPPTTSRLFETQAMAASDFLDPKLQLSESFLGDGSTVMVDEEEEKSSHDIQMSSPEKEEGDLTSIHPTSSCHKKRPLLHFKRAHFSTDPSPSTATEGEKHSERSVAINPPFSLPEALLIQAKKTF